MMIETIVPPAREAWAALRSRPEFNATGEPWMMASCVACLDHSGQVRLIWGGTYATAFDEDLAGEAISILHQMNVEMQADLAKFRQSAKKAVDLDDLDLDL